MLIEKVGHVLPFTPGQVFDLAADIERYPDFLPWYISVSIQKREANTCYVEQVLGRGPLRLQFASKAVLQPPHRIDISSSDLPFRQFSLTVQVLPGSQAGCRLSISAELELRSAFLQRIVQRVLASSMDDIVAAFESRAHRLYDHLEA
jgi:coenzyme Q-binding protein COQ10